eukprot:scaffold63_cov306-Pinguiococcus_pyrenoidosus.AAC.52
MLLASTIVRALLPGVSCSTGSSAAALSVACSEMAETSNVAMLITSEKRSDKIPALRSKP